MKPFSGFKGHGRNLFSELWNQIIEFHLKGREGWKDMLCLMGWKATMIEARFNLLIKVILNRKIAQVSELLSDF